MVDLRARFTTGVWYFSRDTNGRLSLFVKIPQSLSADETALEFFDPSKVSSVPGLIFGRDADDKPVTLFGCRALRGSSSGMRTFNIEVLAAVQGLRLESWSQKCIHAMLLDVDFLHEWLGGEILETMEMPDGRRAFRVPREDEVLVEVSAGVHLRIVRFIAPSSSIEDYSFRCIRHFFNTILRTVAKIVLATMRVRWSSPVLFNDPFDYYFSLEPTFDLAASKDEPRDRFVDLVLQEEEPAFASGNSLFHNSGRFAAWPEPRVLPGCFDDVRAA